MHSCSDINARVHADAALQREISHALAALADSLRDGGDVRIARILSRTLEGSWIEHVSFQEDVIFPILTGRHGINVAHLVAARCADHASLSQQHAVIARQLDALTGARALNGRDIEAVLRQACSHRLSHLCLDGELTARLPKTYTQAEKALCEKWSSLRPVLRFPLNLLCNGELSFPHIGKHVH